MGSRVQALLGVRRELGDIGFRVSRERDIGLRAQGLGFVGKPGGYYMGSYWVIWGYSHIGLCKDIGLSCVLGV